MDLIFLCPNIKSTLAEQDRPSEWLIGWGIATSLIFRNWQPSEIPKWGIRKISLENYIFWVGRWTSCMCVCVLLIISKRRKPIFSFFSIWIQVHLTYIHIHRYHQKVNLSRCGSWLPLSDWLLILLTCRFQNHAIHTVSESLVLCNWDPLVSNSCQPFPIPGIYTFLVLDQNMERIPLPHVVACSRI